jgi:Carboxypeptidase regulatory-like domain
MSNTSQSVAMKYHRSKPIIIFVFLGIFSTCAHAYCPVPEIRPSGEYFKSDVVFTGTVISVRYDGEGWFYQLGVEGIFRGPIQNEFSVYMRHDDNRFAVEKGQTYLLFAYRRRGRLEIDDCGNFRLLLNAAKSIRLLESLSHAPSYGVIEGWVVAETGGIDTSGVQVTVNGGSQNYSAVTGKDGWFHFRAPAGRYKVDFSSGEYYFNAADDFWYNHQHFVLHAGETASLQVVSVRHLVR